MKPRFPGYDVLAKWNSPSWNDATRKAMADRLQNVPRRRFFSEAEWDLLEAICDRLLPQPDRSEPIPLVPWIDQDIHEGRTSGTRYAALPPLQECWRKGLSHIEAESVEQHGVGFRSLSSDKQDALLRAIDGGKVRERVWHDFPAQRFFRHILLKMAVSIYYAHPAAWNEIGFGGPASPRGYVRTGLDRRDPWEAKERHEARREAAT